MKKFTFYDSGGNYTGKAKRWLGLLMFCMMLFVGQLGFAQDYYIVGDGTGSNGTQAFPTPIGNYWWGNKEQYFVTAAQLTASGVESGDYVGSVGFNIVNLNSCPALNNYVIKVYAVTDANPLSAGWVTSGEIASANVGILTPVTGWNQITLDTGFVWNGTDNLVIETCSQNSGWVANGNASVQWTDSGLGVGTWSRWYNADNATVCSATTGPSTSTTIRPNIRFGVSDPPTCLQPIALTATDITATGANLGWTSDGTLFDIEWGVSGFTPTGNPNDVSTTGVSNPFALSGLNQSTAYQFYVRQDCGTTDGVSDWSGPFNFMTTQIPVTLDYEEDFEGAPNWILSNGTQTNKWVIGEATANGGTHSLYISSDDGITNGYNITSTSVVHAYRDIQIPADADSILLSFDWKAQAESCCDYIRVWVVPASFTPVPGTLITAANSGGVQFGANFNLQANWINQWYEIPSMDYAGQIVRLVFEWRNDGSVGTAPSGAIDNVEVSVITCPAPSGLDATGVTTNSAELSWASSGTSFDIDYGVTGFTPSDTPALTEVSNNYALSGLNAATTYQYYVRQNCGTDGISAWAGPYSFTTECETFALPFQEQFSSGLLPNCWANMSSNPVANGLWKFAGAADYGAATAINGKDPGTYAWVDGSTPDNMNDVTLTSPPIDVSSLTVPFLSFEYFSNNTNTYPNNVFTVQVYDGTTWETVFTDNTSEPQWREIEISLTTFTAATLQVRFIVDKTIAPTGNAFYNDILLDNVRVMEAPTCIHPSSNTLAATNVTATDADLSWDSDGALFDIKWGAAGFDVETEGTLASGVGNPYSLSGLSQSTSYEFYVRQDCGTDGVSIWSGPFNFTTTQIPVTLNYEEDFEGVSNWILSNGTQTNKWVIGEATANGGTHSLYISNDDGITNGYSTTSTSVVHAYRDVQIPADADSILLSFDWKAQAESCCDYIRVWVVPASFTPVPGTLITAANSGGVQFGANFNLQANWVNQWYEIPSIDYAGQIVRLVFEWRNDGSIGTAPSGAIDNVEVSVIECPAPSDVTVIGADLDSAEFSWASNGTLFDIEWGESGFTPNSGTMITGITANSYILTGLDSETSYEFYVRQDCGATQSVWAGPYSFFTGYCEVTSTSTTNGVGNFTTTGGIVNINNSSAGGSYSNYTTQYVAQFEGGEDVQFTITSANGTTGMGVWIDWNNDLDFNDSGEHIYNSAAYVATGSGTISIPEGTPVGNYRMRVVANWLSTNPTPCGDLGNIAYGEAEDYTFAVIDPPTCMPPTGLNAANVTADSANLSWTSDGTLFDIKWGVAGFDVDAEGTLINGANSPYSLSGLAQSTAYEFYVRQDCGADDGISLWSGPFSFMTTQIPVMLDYEEDFEGVHNWILSNGTQTNKWVVGEATANGGTHSLYISNDDGITNGYSITSTSVVHAYRDVQIPTDADSILLSFDWKAQAESCCDYIRVWVVPTTYTPVPGTLITAANSGGVQFGANFNLQANWVNQWYEIPSIDYAGQIVRLVFEWRNDGSVGTAPSGAIDNVEISVITCPAPSALAAGNLTLNSADISWASSGTSFNIEYGVAGFTLGTGTTQTATSNSYSLTGLTAHTSYEFYVQQDCGTDGVSAWSGPFFFHTGHCVPSSTYSSDYISSFVTTGGLPFNISNTNSGASPGGYGNFGSMSVSHYETGSVGFTVTAGGDPMGVNIWVDWNNNLEFEESEKVYASGATGASFTGTITVPFGVPLGDYRMRVRGQWNNSNPSPCGNITYGEAEDYTFTVIDPPSCLPPFTPTAVNASATSVSLAWQSNGTLFDIEYGPSGFTQGEGTTISGVGNPYMLTGLTGGTTYDYYVRQDCGEDDGYSMWNGPVTFTPGIFEGDIPTLLNANPQVDDVACATSFSIDVPDGYYLSALNVQYVMMSFNTAMVSQQRSVLYSPTLNMGEAEVAVGGMDFPGMGLYDRDVTFANGATGTVEFQLKAWRTALGSGCGTDYIYVMDGSWVLDAEFELIPSCPEPTNLTYTSTVDSVDLLWTADPDTSVFDIQWGLPGFDPELNAGTTVSGLTATSHTLSDLDSSIVYEFYVRSNCSTDDEDDFSAWVGPVKFNAGHCIPSSTLSYYISTFLTTAAETNISYYSSAINGSGYGDKTDMIVSQFAGESFNFSSNYVGGQSGLRIWVDWNNDFVFADDEEMFYLGSASGTKTGSITIPSDKAPGNYVMRIRTQQGAASIPSACGNVEYGEALDFTLNVATVCDDIAAPTATSPQTLTEGQTVADIVVTDVTGTLNWYADADLTITVAETDVLTAGQYTFWVTQTVGNCISDAIQIDVEVTLSRNAFDEASFRAYPNPVNEILTISYSKDISDVAVVNMLGQVVISQKVGSTDTQVDMSALPTGNYLVKVTVDGAVKTIKVVKQ